MENGTNNFYKTVKPDICGKIKQQRTQSEFKSEVYLGPSNIFDGEFLAK